MQLDKTRIAIRERGLLDSMDLALQVLRTNIWPLLISMLLGALPLAVLNYFLIGWMLTFDNDTIISGEMAGQVPRYIWTMIVLVYIEAPLASVFVTTCLGQVVFLETPSIRTVVRNVAQVSVRVLWANLATRGVLPALLLVLAIDRTESFSTAEGWLIALFPAVCLARCVRPFLSEIVLLEHLPFRSTDKDALTINRRNFLLHGGGSGDLFQRWITVAFYSILLTLGICGAIVSLQGVFFGAWFANLLTLQIGLAATLWLVALFVTVVRFLNYLDTRIRREGWEVELRMRAEAARLVEVQL